MTCLQISITLTGEKKSLLAFEGRELIHITAN